MKPLLRVLVVDDNAEDRAVLLRYLARDPLHAHSVDEVDTGEQAVRVARDKTFDVVLLDQSLPGMDGLAVLKALRAMPSWRGAVVACTSTEAPEAARHAFEAGATDFLHKDNLSPSMLSRAIENALFKHRLQLQVRDAQRRTQQQLQLTEGLSRLATRQGMVGCIVERTLEALEAAGTAVALLSNDGARLAYQPEARLAGAEGQERAIDDLTPLGQCVRKGQLVTWQSDAERDVLFPLYNDELRRYPALVAIPIQGARWQAGAIVLVFERPREFPPEERDFLTLIGKLCGQALDRALLFEQAEGARTEATRSADRYRALVFASAQIVFHVAPDGGVISVSATWEELTGLNNSQSLGFGWTESLHPENLEVYLAERARCLAAGLPVAAEVRIKARGGGYRWLFVHIAPVHDEAGRVHEWIGAGTDITSRKEANEALERERERYRLSNERFELALRSSRLVLFNQDLDLRYTWIHNPALGLQTSEVVGKLEHELFERPEDAAVLEVLKRTVIETGVGRQQQAVIHLGGEARYYDLLVEPLFDAHRSISGVTCAAVDVTELKRLEQGRDQAVLARDQLMAMVSHDLKNPLMVMLLSVEVVRRQLDGRSPRGRDEEMLVPLDRLLRQIKQMDKLVDELFDVVRLHAGLELRRAPVDLVALVRGLAGDHGQGSPFHRIEVSATPPAIIGAWDANQLERVVNNLLSNAVKYSPRGGVIKAELGESREGEATFAMLRVTDHGMGICAADLPRIFDWYARGANALETTIRGLGLGLASARQVVHAHGGTLTVESEEHRGSTFTLRLPERAP